MKTIRNDNTDPAFNLALEEYLLKYKDIGDDLFYVWRNEPCIVIGRNQNPYNEIRIATAEKLGIPIFRRLSGGGTVFHDLGNINFTFLSHKLSQRLNHYDFFLTPLVSMLSKMGLAARFVAPTHIYIGAKKISGNAQTFHQNRMIHHGTLLFKSDTTLLDALLTPSSKYESHAISSTRSDVGNITDYLPLETDITSFMEYLSNEMLQGDVEANTLVLNESDYKAIEELADRKYRTWEWRFGETPSFQVHLRVNHENHTLDIRNGLVSNSTLLPHLLAGKRFEIEALKDILEPEVLHQMFQ